MVRSTSRIVTNLPKKKYLLFPVSLFAFLVTYALIMFIPMSIQFSYSHKTCMNWLSPFPDNYKSSKRTPYQAYPSGLIKIGNTPVLATAVCFAPTESPEKSNTPITLAPFGINILGKAFVITTGSPPEASVALSKPLPVTKPLDVSLNKADSIFTYSLSVQGKSTTCKPKDKSVSCDLTPLHLAQGESYTIAVSRQFGKKDIEKITERQVTTLAATRITNSTIKPGEIVYARPKNIDFSFDKRVVKAKAVLTRMEAGKPVAVPTTTRLDGYVAHIELENELPRQSSYVVTMTDVEAEDGSSLEQTYALPFSMSGGPKVTSISVGKSGVALGATAVITFDQALSGKQDKNQVITMSGGATIIRADNDKLFVSLANVPKCGDFLIKISDNLESAYDIKGGSNWSFAGRMICHTIGTVGYSSRGRPIIAYYFGSGPRTVVYTGAIHGNETNTKSLMEKWISELESKAKSIPADKSIIVIPQVNPDGISAGTRVNARNIDLNRNFATSDWRKDITTVNNQPFPGGGGESPMSEPETQALASFISRVRPVLVLSYHSVGGVVAANQAGNSTGLTNQYAQLSGYRNTTGQSSTTFEYSISGTADDWYAERLGVASILIELGSSTYHQFERNQNAMWAMVNS